MAVIEFSRALRERFNNRAPVGNEFDLAVNPTQTALRRVISPVPQSGLFSSGAYLRGLPTLGGRSASSGPSGPNLVPGPLGVWEEDKGRPRQQIGKFGTNLMGSGQSFAPGAPSPYDPNPPDRAAQLRALAAPDNPENDGFLEGLFGAIGGAIGGVFGQEEGGQSVGRFIGSGADLPFEAAGNIAGLPLGLASGALFQQGRIDDDIRQVYEEASKDNPIQGLLLWSHMQKAQWQREHDAGLHTGLLGGNGPATALTDQVGLLMNLVFGGGAAGVQRVVMGDKMDESIRTVEQAVRRGATVEQDPETGEWVSSDDRVKATQYANLQMRLARGDFGPIGSEQARDKMRDEIIATGGALRDVSDVPQVAGEGANSALPFNMTFQGLADIAFQAITDPTIIASFGIGAVAKGAQVGMAAANTKFWTAVPAAARPRLTELIEQTAQKVGGFSTPEQGWVALGRAQRTLGSRVRTPSPDDIAFESRVLREVVEHPDMAPYRSQLKSSLDYLGRWHDTWEPALRPVVGLVRTLNDPQRLFGAGKASKAAGDVFSAHATEGVIRGTGSLNAHANLQRTLGALPGDFRAVYDRGLAVSSAFAARVYHRDGLMADIRRRLAREDPTVHNMMTQYLPDEVVYSRMGASRAGDIATGMEQQSLRYRPAYVDQGGTEGLARAREEAVTRLQLMGVSPTDARTLAGRMDRDEIALLDRSYFGVAMDEFVTAKEAASAAGVTKGAVNPDELTMLGPNQMTMQRAADVLEAVNRGDIAEVRAALQRYDILFENLGEKLPDAKLMKAVRELLEDQVAAKALPRDLDSLEGLSDDLVAWARRNGEFGYRIGFRPPDDQLWRMTKDAEGNVLGVNPWLEVASTASSVPTYTRSQLARDALFHAVRGERIMADARVRMAEYVTGRWGISRGDSDALFARFIKMATETGVTPRGLAPEQVYQIVVTHGLPEEIVSRIGPREAIEALLHAFEGKFMHVGVTQKFTGRAKTGFGGQGNWLGQIAEAIYPRVRFSLNPVFQAQELTESFILNLMRGIRPGMSANELDTQTLDLIKTILRDSKYAYDDQIEYGGTLLWGADAAHQAFGPASSLGKVTRKLSLGDRINVKEMKRVNYAKATREILGKAFREDMERVAPDMLPKLRAHYGTDDWGHIAVKYMSEKGLVGQTPVDVLKPSYLGARNPVNLDKVARHFDGVANADELRAAVRAGKWDEAGFRDVLIEAGGDEDFVSRAFITAAAEFTPEEWWDAYRINFKMSNARATAADRALVKAVAEVHNMSEAEYLAKYMADVPHSVDERALAVMADTEKRWFQFMEEAVDGGVHKIAVSADERIEQFRLRNAHVADREFFEIIDRDGTVVASGQQGKPWKINLNGSITEAGLGDEINPFLPSATGRILIHNHPSHNPFSPADMATAAIFDVDEMIVTSPGVTYSLKPASVEDGRWWTAELDEMFGGYKATEEEMRLAMDAMWRSDANGVYEALRSSPYYARRLGDRWDEYLDGVATVVATQRMADRFGWTFNTVTDYRLPLDDALRHEQMARMAEQSIPSLKQQYPYTYTSAPLGRIEARAGTSVAYEVDTSINEIWPSLPDELHGPVLRDMDDFYFTEIAPKAGVAVTDARRARGMWRMDDGTVTDSLNAVQDVFGTKEQMRTYAAMLGYLNRQWAVFTSKAKVGAKAANYGNKEALSWEFIASRALTDDEAIALQRAVGQASPDIAGWGSSVVRTTDGRTAIRFTNTQLEGVVGVEDFRAQTLDQALGPKMQAALDQIDGYDVEAQVGVVDFEMLDNNWDEAANGETYRAIIGEQRPDLLAELDALDKRAQSRLVQSLRTHAPAEFEAHLDGLRAAGRPIPEWDIPGDFAPTARLADRLSISIPGGREGLAEGARTFNLWEQQVLKAQTINAAALYNADPLLYTQMMRAIWKGKYKEIEAGLPNDSYNAFVFALLTGTSPLDVTEGAYSLVRASMEPGIRGVERMVARAQRIIGKLPERFQRNEAYIGTMFQIDEGLRVSGYKLQKADWLSPEHRSTIDRFQTRFDQAMREMPEEQREAFARAVQKRLDGGVVKGRASRVRRVGPDVDVSFVDDIVDIVGINRRKGVSVQVHPFATDMTFSPVAGGGPQAPLETFISVGRPSVQFKAIGTNTQWGRALKWLNDGIFSSDNAAVQRFIRIQANESREAYALRMSSMLRGIDVKTAMMAMQSAGPRAISHGALDTHIVRYIMQKAMKRGDLDGLIERISPQYAKHLREEVARGLDNASTSFTSPEGDVVYLVPDGKWRGRPWSPEKEQLMRSRLHLIEDPEVRALYEDPEVLRLVSQTHGKINRWGGDYAVLDDYFNTVLKQEEVDTLRAAGHAEAADMVEAMSGGEFQWFKWDQIRSAINGTPLDPHVGVTRGADLIPNRVGAELDRAIATSRLGTPYDPKQMLFQKSDGRILGANQIMEDNRRILLATQEVDGRTGLHELAHVFEQHLDPSMRETVIAEFRKATGSRRTTWSREVGEWWADSLLAYARAGHRPGNAALRPSFDYFRKTLNGIEATIKAQQEAKVLAKTKASAIRKATAAVEKATPAVRQTTAEVRAAQRAQQAANRELRRARARGSLDVLEGRAQVAKDEVLLLDQQVKDAKAAVRVARSAARTADMRAQQAVGTASAGGLRASAKRAAQRIDTLVAETERLSQALDRAREAATKASRKVAGARRRTPVDAIERARDKARVATEAALAKQRAAEKALAQARRSLDEAKALPTKPARAKVKPIPLSDEMRQIWDDITTPPETSPTTVGTGQPYDLQQEAVYQAARHSLSRAEEEAFRLHYYKRGRNFLERSINHPYFGLYPASYMWGKILPELIRFLVRKPFGVDAPLGGLALSHNIYRGVMVQQQYDPEFRRQMVENTDMWHFISMMTPSLPWEIPVNAPLWARRFAEANLVRGDKLDALTPEQRAALTPEQLIEDYPVQSLQQMGRTGREMLNYAFGPAAAIEQVTTAIAGAGELATDSVQTTVDTILRAGLGQPEPVQPQQPSLFGSPEAMMPAQGPGSNGP